MKGRHLILFISGALSFSALAHHSDAIYDRESIVAGEGIVTQYVFRNPHVLIGVEIEDEAGDVAEWLVETGSTPIMRRSGWSEDLISVGDTIRVRLHPEKSGRPHGILNTMELETGEMFHQVEGPAEETVAAESLTGVWRGAGSVFGLARNIVPNAAGEAAQAAYTGPDPSKECDPLPAPYSIGSGNYLTGIELLEDRVILRNEFLDSHRTVWMDGRDHPEDGEYTIQGHSIGSWEGETLVIDTRYFEENERGNSRGGGVPSSREKHVVLRYTLSDDRRRAIVEFVVEDPVYLAEPWQGQMELVYSPHLQLYDYNCIPGTLG